MLGLSPGNGTAVNVVICAVYPGDILLFCWLLYLWLRFRRAFNEAARLAAATWAAAPPSS